MLEGEVEADESLFARHKYHRGRSRTNMKSWVLGLKERGTNRCRFFVVGNDRSEAKLLPLILQSVKRGTIIYTDHWGAYNNLSEHGYIHLKVNHSVEYVNRGLE
jgi:transposase-like protein